jgi:hypothetical protein
MKENNTTYDINDAAIVSIHINELDVHGSVHHNINLIERTNKM